MSSTSSIIHIVLHKMKGSGIRFLLTIKRADDLGPSICRRNRQWWSWFRGRSQKRSGPRRTMVTRPDYDRGRILSQTYVIGPVQLRQLATKMLSDPQFSDVSILAFVQQLQCPNAVSTSHVRYVCDTLGHLDGKDFDVGLQVVYGTGGYVCLPRQRNVRVRTYQHTLRAPLDRLGTSLPWISIFTIHTKVASALRVTEFEVRALCTARAGSFPSAWASTTLATQTSCCGSS